MNVQDAEALLATRRDAEQSIVELFEIDDARERADFHGRRRAACLAPRDDQRDTEAGVFAHAAADHVEIARLENAQPQRPAREQHGVQREERNRCGGRTTHEASWLSAGEPLQELFVNAAETPLDMIST